MQSGFHFNKIKIIKIKRETALAKTFFFESVDPGINYRAGQFLTILFSTPFGEKRRSYSFSSSPGVDSIMSITVKRMDNGEFSRYMIDSVEEGDILTTVQPAGFFTLPAEDFYGKTFVFFAAGSGITPCFSLIKSLLSQWRNRVVLIYSNGSPNDTIFYDEINELQNKNAERFVVRYQFSTSPDLLKGRLSKWNLPQILEEHLATIKDCLFYLCGPFEYVRMIRIVLRSLSIEDRFIKKENFNELPPAKLIAPDDTGMHNVRVHINGQLHDLRVKYPESIIATAKMSGIELPYSCEAGRCGSCVARCTKGKIWMAYNEVLTEKEVEQGLVLTCQGFPVNGDAEIFF